MNSHITVNPTGSSDSNSPHIVSFCTAPMRVTDTEDRAVIQHGHKAQPSWLVAEHSNCKENTAWHKSVIIIAKLFRITMYGITIKSYDYHPQNRR